MVKSFRRRETRRDKYLDISGLEAAVVDVVGEVAGIWGLTSSYRGSAISRDVLYKIVTTESTFCSYPSRRSQIHHVVLTDHEIWTFGLDRENISPLRPANLPSLFER